MIIFWTEYWNPDPDPTHHSLKVNTKGEMKMGPGANFIIGNTGNQMGPRAWKSPSPGPHHRHHTTGLSESQDPTAPDGPWEDEGSGRNAKTGHRRQKGLMSSQEGPGRRSFNRWWQTPGTCPVRPPPFGEMKTDLGKRIETFEYCVALLNDSFISSEEIS